MKKLIILLVLVFLIIGCNNQNKDIVVENISQNNILAEEQVVSVSIDLSTPEKMAEEYIKLYMTSEPGKDKEIKNALIVSTNVKSYLNEPIRFRNITNYKFYEVDWHKSKIFIGVDNVTKGTVGEHYGIGLTFTKETVN